ncbi:hypothetical protein KM043_013825 [Ampulex compressa]|nr:hypothetical protein KM043_013825 [Ampulex compressa]
MCGQGERYRLSLKRTAGRGINIRKVPRGYVVERTTGSRRPPEWARASRNSSAGLGLRTLPREKEEGQGRRGPRRKSRKRRKGEPAGLKGRRNRDCRRREKNPGVGEEGEGDAERDGATLERNAWELNHVAG